MLSGDNGILKKAVDAKEQTGISQEKEILVLAYNSALGKKVSNNDSILISAGDLNTELANQGAFADGDNPITVTFEKSGNIYIINSDGNIEKYIPLQATGISFTSETASIKVGETLQLKPTLQPQGAKGIVSYKSSDTTIATVTDLGIVTGVAKGSTKVTATVNEKSAEITILVTTVPLQPGETATVENQEYISDGKTAIIPKNFTVSSNESSINTGLVVIGPDGSEFVWIPIDKETLNPIGATRVLTNKEMAEKISGKWRGILYTFSGSGFNITSSKIVYSETGFREPAYLTNSTYGDANTSNNKIGINKNSLQQEYNEIIESIKANGGFYVGRYESSLGSGDKIQSKKGTNIKPASAYSLNMWYGLYNKQKTYAGTTITGTSLKSTIMTGACYDAMLNWALNSGNDTTKVNATTNGNHGVSVKECGSETADRINNIFDLEGNMQEYTFEACEDRYRTIRGRYKQKHFTYIKI